MLGLTCVLYTVVRVSVSLNVLTWRPLHLRVRVGLGFRVGTGVGAGVLRFFFSLSPTCNNKVCCNHGT